MAIVRHFEHGDLEALRQGRNELQSLRGEFRALPAKHQESLGATWRSKEKRAE